MTDRFLIVLDAQGLWHAIGPGETLPENASAFVPTRCTRVMAALHASELNGISHSKRPHDVGRKLAALGC